MKLPSAQTPPLLRRSSYLTQSWTISWREVASFRATAEDEVLALAWDPQGGRLLMGGSSISLWCDKVSQ